MYNDDGAKVAVFLEGCEQMGGRKGTVRTMQTSQVQEQEEKRRGLLRVILNAAEVFWSLSG